MNTVNPRTSKMRWIAIFIAVVAIGAVLSWLLRDSSTQDALRLYGNVDIREVDLSFRQPGRIAEMAFDEGDSVSAGKVMARLDAGPYHDAVAAAEAALRAANAELDKLHSGNRPQEITQARERVRQAEAAAREAERNYTRQRSLLESGASSQRTVDAALTAHEHAAANLAASKAALSLATAGFRDEDIAAGEARVAVADAALAQARTALSDTQLVAPSDATVIARVREPGSMVASSTPVYSLSLRDPVYVRAYISEPDLGRIAPGAKVQVRTDSSSKIYHGQIGFISPRAEFTPKTVETVDLRTDLVYRLRIVVTDADLALRQGMPITVEVDADLARDERVRE